MHADPAWGADLVRKALRGEVREQTLAVEMTAHDTPGCETGVAYECTRNARASERGEQFARTFDCTDATRVD